MKILPPVTGASKWQSVEKNVNIIIFKLVTQSRRQTKIFCLTKKKTKTFGIKRN